MQYLFHPDELKAGIGPDASALEFLSCQRIELDGQNPTATVETGPQETALVCIAGRFDYRIDGAGGTAEYKDMLYVPVAIGFISP